MESEPLLGPLLDPLVDPLFDPALEPLLELLATSPLEDELAPEEPSEVEAPALDALEELPPADELLPLEATLVPEGDEFPVEDVSEVPPEELPDELLLEEAEVEPEFAALPASG